MPMLAITHSTTAWLLVIVSGLLEVAFSMGMKFSDGYTRLLPALMSVVAGLLSVWLMSQTLRLIPIGTAYAVWAGIGAVGTALAGMVLLHEPASPARIICIGLVIAGIVGLQWQEAA